MGFRAYLWLMGLASLLAWGTFAFVVYAVDPDETGMAGLFLFYVTLTLALMGTLAVIGVIYRVGILKRKSLVSREVGTAFRHAFIFSLVAVVSLALAASGNLSWMGMAGLLLFVGMIEYGFVLVQENRR